MKLVETDPNSGAEIYQLIDDPRPADNIYGEQPYASDDGSRVTIRYYPQNGQDGGLSFLDLADGSLHTVIAEAPRFPRLPRLGRTPLLPASRRGRARAQTLQLSDPRKRRHHSFADRRGSI